MTVPRFVKFRGSLYVFGALGFFILVVVVHMVGQRAGLGWPEAIYFVTGLVVLWYTIETWKLRHEMRRQTNLQSRPLLSVTVAGTRVILKNVGLGPARNIRTRDVHLPSTTTITLKGALLPHLSRDDTAPIPFRVFMGPGGEFPESDRDWKIASILKEGRHDVAITYGSIAGAWYETKIRFADGAAWIKEDEETGVPEAEHQ